MKKVGYCLIIISLIATGVVCGFLWGRNHTSSDGVHISGTLSPAAPQIETNTSATEKHSVSVTKKININTATEDEFCTLPGIGPALAKRIVDYREQNGPFPNVEALTGVSGIGYKTLEKILQFITTGGVS